MKKLLYLLLFIFLVVGCAKSSTTTYYPPIDDDDGSGGNDDPPIVVPSGPVNIDPNIESITIGSKAIGILYQDTYLYDSDLELGSNFGLILDTFNEDPQFTADETITLDEGQVYFNFTDSIGDWPEMLIGFY